MPETRGLLSVTGPTPLSGAETANGVSPGLWGLRLEKVISDLRGHEDLRETVALPPVPSQAEECPSLAHGNSLT